jgi:hypothetical protein
MIKVFCFSENVVPVVFKYQFARTQLTIGLPETLDGKREGNN